MFAGYSWSLIRETPSGENKRKTKGVFEDFFFFSYDTVCR